jgi:gag-polyprotein putative aspartyl protease
MSKQMKNTKWLVAALLAGVSSRVLALPDNNTYVAQCSFGNKSIAISISADANNTSAAVSVNDGTVVYGRHQQVANGQGHMIYENNTSTQWYVAPQYSTRYQSSVKLQGKWYPMNCGGFQYTVIAGANEPPAQAYAPNYAPTQDPPTTAPTQDPPTTYAQLPDVKTIIPAPSTSGTDSLTITMYPEGTNLQSVDITLGNSTPARVIVDTGASILNIKESLGDALIASGEATVLKTIDSTIADGSTVTEQLINISQITIGGHTLYNIKATVGPENAMMLLGMEILNRFSKFSIDTGHNQLILG